MSADLDFCPDLPKFRTLKIRPGPKTGDGKVPAVADTISTNVNEDASGDGFRTPKTEKHGIPAVTECPPAPRKPKRTVACKRKLIEFDFFEAVNRDEVEGFFRSSFDDVVKRRCFCK